MTTDEERITRVRQKALENDFHSGCSQSVLLALQEEFGLGDIESFKAATVLSGGVARKGETCGAILGALMALGLAIGREEMADTETYRKAMGPAQEIRRRFQTELHAQFGFSSPVDSTLCRDIQARIYGRSFDLSDPAQNRAFLEAGGHSARGCPKTCAVAAQVAAEWLLGWDARQRHGRWHKTGSTGTQ